MCECVYVCVCVCVCVCECVCVWFGRCLEDSILDLALLDLDLQLHHVAARRRSDKT